MKPARLGGILFACLACFSLQSHAVTIDFQALEHVDTLQADHGTTYTEDGFTLTGTIPFGGSSSFFSNGTLRTTPSVYKGSTALFNGTISGITTLTANSGSAFNLFSIDLAELDNLTSTVTFTGNLQAGGTVSQAFTMDGISGFGFGFETFNFSGFTNVTSVTWQQFLPFHQFDNIVVSAVPVPAAVWLFGSGLLGLVGMARRKKAA